MVSTFLFFNKDYIKPIKEIDKNMGFGDRHGYKTFYWFMAAKI